MYIYIYNKACGMATAADKKYVLYRYTINAHTHITFYTRRDKRTQDGEIMYAHTCSVRERDVVIRM